MIFSLFPRAKLSPLYIRAQHPSPNSVGFLADLTCASQKEMSVHLETLHVQATANSTPGGAHPDAPIARAHAPELHAQLPINRTI